MTMIADAVKGMLAPRLITASAKRVSYWRDKTNLVYQWLSAVPLPNIETDLIESGGAQHNVSQRMLEWLIPAVDIVDDFKSPSKLYEAMDPSIFGATHAFPMQGDILYDTEAAGLHVWEVAQVGSVPHQSQFASYDAFIRVVTLDCGIDSSPPAQALTDPGVPAGP